MSHRPMTFMLVLFAGASLSTGCFPVGSDEVEVYRAALPLGESVTLGGPENARPSNGQDIGNANNAATSGTTSKYYAFTRGVRDGVNRVTASVLGTVWYIANTRPTEIDDEEAIWGPYTDPLEPATWRFHVTRIAGEKYAYVLEGRPKDSGTGAAYTTVLNGTGYGRNDERHGDGTFFVDLDAAKELDPVAHADDAGTISVVHDLPSTIAEEFAPLPRRLEVDVAKSTSGATLSIVSLARADHTGVLTVTGVADIDESHATALEDVSVVSQWNATGAGRADVTIGSGDVPAALDPLTATECWASDFKQSYYTDSASIQIAMGEPSSCAFAVPAEVE